MAEILDGIEAELRATEGVTWKELRMPANMYRMFITITIQIGMHALSPKMHMSANTTRCAIDRQHLTRVLYVHSDLLYGSYH
jgi:hypothetical protein